MSEQAHGHEKHMKKPERYARAIGGYALAFLGTGMQLGGIASLNPLPAVAGTALAYAGHRVLNPYFNAYYGVPVRPRSRLESFLRFEAGIIPTYIGASLLGNAVFGGLGQNAPTRLVEGVVGGVVLGTGSLIERSMHTGDPLLHPRPLHTAATHPEPAPDYADAAATHHEAQPPHPDQSTGFSMRGLYNRMKLAAINFRHPVPAPDAPTVMPPAAAHA